MTMRDDRAGNRDSPGSAEASAATVTAAEPIAVIADIVGSRRHADRDALQYHVEAALAAAGAVVESLDPLAPTVGDEFQGVYASLPAALAATGDILLRLDGGIGLRFGFGRGAVVPVASDVRRIQDGPGWWRAREALECVEREELRIAERRSRFVGPDANEAAVVNAYLLLRDAAIAAMTPRERDYARGALEGRSQREIADAIGVTQPAVSRALRRSGAVALIDGYGLLRAATIGAANPEAGEANR